MKRTALIVIGTHIFFIGWMALWLPIKKHEKKPLLVKTTVYTPPPPPAPAKPAPVKIAKTTEPVKRKPTPKAKKPSPKPPPKHVAKAKPKVPKKLAEQLQKSLAKIDAPPQPVKISKPLSTPKKITSLKIDQIVCEDAGKYVGDLIECLQSMLHLPDVGAVKIELTLTREGKCTQVRVLRSESVRNQAFLERELKNVSFPPFSGPLKEEKEHLFVVTFCNS